jgi:hypothetical protein
LNGVRSADGFCTRLREAETLSFEPVFPVYTVFDKDGTVLTEQDFTDVFH